jgi:hypothetical protein
MNSLPNYDKKPPQSKFRTCSDIEVKELKAVGWTDRERDS